MLITPSTLEYARARRHDLEREAQRERPLRVARAALRACREARADAACGPNGCGGAAEGCAAAPPRPSHEVARRRTWQGGAFVGAAIARAVRPLRTVRPSRCAPSRAAA